MTFWGVTIQSVFNLIGLGCILYVAYNMIDIALKGILPSILSASLDYYEDSLAAFLGTVVICFSISFLGYILYLVGICLFKRPQRSVNSNARVRNIMIVELLMPVLLILFFVIYYKCIEIVLASMESAIIYCILPFVGSLAAIIFLLVQFGSLSKEDSWSEKSRGGASDVQTSYACLLWMLCVLILGCGLIALTIYSFINNLDSIRQSGYGYQDMFDGVNALSRKVNDLVTTVKLEAMFTILVIFILGAWSTIKRIVGWRMIQNGGNEEVYRFSSNRTSGIGSVRFCHKCGKELPEGSAFCPGCGTPVVIIENSVESSEEVDNPEINTIQVSDYEDYETDKKDEKKKWILWGGISVAVIAVALGIWSMCSRSDKMEENSRIVAHHSVIFKNVNDGIGIDEIDDLKFGTPVECRDSELGEDEKWTKVAFEKDGKVLTGYIAKADLVSPDDFLMLEKAGLSDSDIQVAMPYRSERLALLDALKTNEGNWRLEVVNSYNQKEPNLKRLTIKRANPSEDCIGFIMQNEIGDRRTFIYSVPGMYNTDNTQEPTYLYSEPLIGNWDGIYDVNLTKRGRYDITYVRTEETDYSDSFLYEDSAIDEESENKLIGSVQMSSLVDGKYPVKMKLTIDAYNNVSSTVTYLKYNVPREINGTYSDMDGYYDLSLEEMSDGQVTGNFFGKYDGKEFSGLWVKADGSKEMPFKLSR